MTDEICEFLVLAEAEADAKRSEEYQKSSEPPYEREV